MTKTDKETDSSQKPDTIKEAISFVKTLVVLVAIAIVIRASLIEAFRIPSGSMIPTLLIGDHILVTKLNYGIWVPFRKKSVIAYSQPKRGDIVVFTRPDDPMTETDESDMNIIKRVIGLPGDKIKVERTRVFINGKKLKEPYAVWEQGGSRDFYVKKVPEGHVFMMGDNRDHSKDSRFWTDSPFLDIRRIKGKALIIYWNLQQPLRRITKLIK